MTTTRPTPTPTRHIVPQPAEPIRRKLTAIPTDRHPLNLRQFSALYDALATAGDRFHALGHPSIGAELADAASALWRAWNLIQETERAEYAAAEREDA